MPDDVIDEHEYELLYQNSMKYRRNMLKLNREEIFAMKVQKAQAEYLMDTNRKITPGTALDAVSEVTSSYLNRRGAPAFKGEPIELNENIDDEEVTEDDYREFSESIPGQFSGRPFPVSEEEFNEEGRNDFDGDVAPEEGDEDSEGPAENIPDLSESISITDQPMSEDENVDPEIISRIWHEPKKKEAINNTSNSTFVGSTFTKKSGERISGLEALFLGTPPEPVMPANQKPESNPKNDSEESPAENQPFSPSMMQSLEDEDEDEEPVVVRPKKNRKKKKKKKSLPVKEQTVTHIEDIKEEPEETHGEELQEPQVKEDLEDEPPVIPDMQSEEIPSEEVNEESNDLSGPVIEAAESDDREEQIPSKEYGDSLDEPDISEDVSEAEGFDYESMPDAGEVPDDDAQNDFVSFLNLKGEDSPSETESDEFPEEEEEDPRPSFDMLTATWEAMNTPSENPSDTSPEMTEYYTRFSLLETIQSIRSSFYAANNLVEIL